jgi:hypothetical protein
MESRASKMYQLLFHVSYQKYQQIHTNVKIDCSLNIDIGFYTPQFTITHTAELLSNQFGRPIKICGFEMKITAELFIFSTGNRK